MGGPNPFFLVFRFPKTTRSAEAIHLRAGLNYGEHFFSFWGSLRSFFRAVGWPMAISAIHLRGGPDSMIHEPSFVVEWGNEPIRSDLFGVNNGWILSETEGRVWNTLSFVPASPFHLVPSSEGLHASLTLERDWFVGTPAVEILPLSVGQRRWPWKIVRICWSLKSFTMNETLYLMLRILYE